jgi:hypothetical protein
MQEIEDKNESKDRKLVALDAIMRGASLHAAGTKAGYTRPNRDLSHVFFDIRAMKYCHAKTKGMMVIQGAPAAYKFMFDTMMDGNTDKRLRVRCAEFILTVAGHVPAKASENPLADAEERDAKEMSVKELDAMLARINAIKENRALEKNTIDVTPQPATQAFESLF